MDPLHMADNVILRSPLLGDAGFVHGFSTRVGGVSGAPFATLNLGIPRHGSDATRDDPAAIADNLRRFLAAMSEASGPSDLPGARRSSNEVHEVLTVDQVHGGHVALARQIRSALPARTQADAIVAEAGEGEGAVAIGVRVADCVPVLVAEPETGHVAAVHAGWRGVLADVVAHAVSSLDALRAGDRGARGPVRRLAAIGPCIGACCFEVGPEVAAQWVARCGTGALRVRDGAEGERPHVDLRWAVRQQLRAAGLEGADIDDVAGCTRCDASRFFSFRRDGQASGRHLAAIVPLRATRGTR